MRYLFAMAAVLVLAGCASPTPATQHTEPEQIAEAAPSSPMTKPSPTVSPDPPRPGNQSAPAKAQRERLANGHIVVGGPHSRIFWSLAVLGVSNVDGFFFKPPANGINVTTVTKDNRGAGYDLDFNFHDAAGNWLGGCATPVRDEVCIVPKNASRGEVVAHSGIDLDVEVFTAPDLEGSPTSRG